MIPEIQIYSPQLTREMRKLGLEENYRGPVFGKEMYKVLARAKLVINRHGNPLSKYGNVRTFEATGMGCALLTEGCDGLASIFKPESEVFTYNNLDDIGLRAKIILDSLENISVVSRAGQHRTLESHTYKQRYSELETSLLNLLRK
jgi:spore maturation protein CgeB